MPIFKRVISSARVLYNARPRNREALAVLHQQKMGHLREAGFRQVILDGGRTALNLVDSIVVAPPSSSAVDLEEIHSAYPLFRYLPDTLAIETTRSFPSAPTPITLIDRKNGYTCYQLEVNDENNAKIEEARGTVATALSQLGYVGWDDVVNGANDLNAYWFVVEDREGNIVATSRMIHRRSNNTLPFEQALRPDDKTHYSLTGETENIVDINSFNYRRGDGKALYILFAALARHAWLMRCTRGFCILDQENQHIEKLYRRAGFRFSRQFPEKVHFPGFGKIIKGELQPTQWAIMEMGQRGLFFHNTLRMLKGFKIG